MKADLKNMVEIFKAFADANRLKIISLLSSNSSKEYCVNDIKKELKISQPAVSQHIKILKNIRLLEPDKRGYFVYYKINTGKLEEYQGRINDMMERTFQK